MGGLTFGWVYKNLLGWGSSERRIFPGCGDEQIFGLFGGLTLSPNRKNPDDLVSKKIFLMFYIRIDKNKNSKYDTLKQISLRGILNTLCRPEHPSLGMSLILISEQDTSYVYMNQFFPSMEVYPHTKYSTS